MHYETDERHASQPEPMSAASPPVPALLATALQHHLAGCLDQAEPIYRQILATDPRHAGTLHLLGALAYQTGRHVLAIEKIRAAIAVDAKVAAYRADLGAALWENGQTEEAIASYRTAIQLDPNALEANCELGRLLGLLGQHNEAMTFHQRTLNLRPDYPQAHNNMGNTLRQMNRPDEAIACFRGAIDIKPDFLEATFNLGVALLDQQYPDEAIACFRRVLALKPDLLIAWEMVSSLLWKQGRLDEAITCYRTIIDLNPGHQEAHVNLGNIFRRQARLDDAIACFRAALDRNPGFPEAHFGLALMLLAGGDMAEGWREFEWRIVQDNIIAGRTVIQPRWRGEPGKGRTLLIHSGDGGFGDTTQFCRFASLIADSGIRVVLAVQAPLVRLLRSLRGIDLVLAEHGDLPAFDLYCPMLSLPFALQTTLETIPSAVPYLHADPSQISAWRTRLVSIAGQAPRIGLVWAGNPYIHSPMLAQIDRRRSLDPERLAPLFDIPGVRFSSLQRGGPKAPEHFPLTDFMNEMHDFADTAALVANLDLVISVDTSVAHLAASLGKPVWLLDRFDSCWRWLTGRRDSPWYPTVRIYRQPQPGDWDSVLAEIARDLRGLTAHRD